MDRLPWVMLGRRTAFQPALDCSAAELVFGGTPTIPGDLAGEPSQPLTQPQLKQLLHGLQANASRAPVQTTHNRHRPINLPDLSKVTHVYLRKGKTTPLGPNCEGPFKINRHISQSCIEIRVGTSAGGEPRLEMHHALV